MARTRHIFRLELALGGLMLALSACAGPAPLNSASALTDAERGKVLVVRQACGSCHEIPGLSGADGLVGPSLAGFARRPFIAGVLPNTSENLAAWVRSPQTFVPADVMPASDLSQREARDVARFLESLG